VDIEFPAPTLFRVIDGLDRSRRWGG